MADSTTAAETTVKASSAATKAAVNRVAKEAVSAAIADQALPLIAETTELALEVPSKVVLNQKVVFAVGVIGGVALGAGILYGVNKFIHRNKKNPSVVDSVVVEDGHRQVDPTA